MSTRWKDKSDIVALAAGDRVPVTDVSDANVDKYFTPAEMATYVGTTYVGVTDNAVARFNGAVGIQNSGVIIDDSNNVSGAVNLTQAGYHDLTEIAAPASPAANVARVYAIDDSAGVTTLALKDAAGNVVPLSHFKQTGTGSVTRTQDNKFRDFISVTDFGADPTGVADSAAKIQAALDAAALIVTARATVLIPSTALGNSYKIASALTWPANVNIVCDPGVRIFASASMASMLQTGTGSSNRLRNVWLSGGRWDANFLATSIFRLKDAEKVNLCDFSGIQCGTYVDGISEAASAYIWIGDASQSASCYEIIIDRFRLYRTDASGSPTPAPANNYGIRSLQSFGASDCHVLNGVINGVKFGVAGELAHWKLTNVHVWNYLPEQGAMVNGIYCTDFGGVHVIGCQIDTNTAEVPIRLEGTSHPSIIAATQINCTAGTDNAGLAIQIGTGAQVTAAGNVITCDVAHRFAVDFSGSLALLSTYGHQNKNVVTPVANSGVTTPDGRLTAGHTAPIVGPTGVTAKQQALGLDANAASIVARFSANASPGRIGIAKSRGATVGDFTIVQSGDSLGEIVAMGANGTDLQNAAIVSFEVDGTPGAAADMPGRILFKTSPDGSSTPAERWRITRDGPLIAASMTLPTAAAGAIEYDGKAFYATAAASSRQAVNAEQTSILTADRAGTDVSTAQAMFGTTEDALTLAANTTYEFEALYYISRAAGTTSHTSGVLFGGTATFTSIDFLAQVTNPTGNALANVQQIMSSAATLVTLTAANTSATENLMIWLRGTIRTNGAGTIIPQFQFSAAPGGAPTIKRNSFFRCWPIGVDTVASVGNWA